jgi:uncharacterized protein involved in response to NO
MILPMTSLWRIVSAAPHRLMFFGGILQLLLTIGWWLSELLGRSGIGIAIPTTIASTWGHMILMVYGFPTFFIFGFLMTTYPRWMNGQPIPYHRYVLAFGLLIAAVLLIYIGLLTNKAILLTGIILLLMGWGIAFYALLQVYWQAPARDKHYESILNFALLAGWLGVLAYFWWLVTEQYFFLDLARHGGIWLYLLPILITVCHRMIPYFSSCVLPHYQVVQPSWSLPLMGISVIGHLILEIQGLFAWRLIFDIPLMLLAFHHSFFWDLKRSLTIRLLAMLHIAFLWLGIALLLYNIQSLVLLWSGQFLLGRAPLHALTIGFITSLIIGMSSRVILGHSGRVLVADNLTWFCFLSVSVIAWLRIAAELPGLDKMNLMINIVTASSWLICLLPWFLRYMPMILRARVDGRAG